MYAERADCEHYECRTWVKSSGPKLSGAGPVHL